MARAIIHSPDFIIADEPTGNLDTETSNMINELFMKINQEIHRKSKLRRNCLLML